MKAKKSSVQLPIGPAAALVYDIDQVRRECCVAAERMTRRKRFDEAELEECARLDDGLAAAERILRATLTNVTLLRLRRRSRAR